MNETLYRKYRPQSFAEVKGQEHIKSILLNALASENVAHAYIFAGPHGTGKTSVARILAKELGVSGVDLVEIDAASHRGIDDVRQIRESVQFQPTDGKYKFYILDEVHMLTSEAFNALLKTLEEPPAHAYFVLCTTEPHKVPLTILSRCQRLNFQSANKDELKTHLQEIAKQEGYELSDEASELLVDNTRGSYRDALVLLAQAIRLEEGQVISPISIQERIGLITSANVDRLFNLIVQKDANSFAEEVKNTSKGVDGTKMIMGKIIDRLVFEVLQDGSSAVIDRSSLIVLTEKLIEARRKIAYVDQPTVPFVVAVLSWMYVKELPQSTAVNIPQSVVPQTLKPKAAVVPAPPKKIAKEEPVKQTSSPVAVVEEVVTIQNPIAAGPMEETWVLVMQAVRDKKRSVEALLKAATIENIDDEELSLSFAYDFHKKKVEETENRTIIESVLEDLLGKKIRLRCQLANEVKKPSREKSGFSDVLVETDEEIAQLKAGAVFVSEEDLIKKAQEILGGQLIE